MGLSTDAEINFGILFEEEHEFPWEYGDIEPWWREVNGYKPPFEMYDRHGEYLPGFSTDDPRKNEYYESQRNWDKYNPIPFREVNYQSADYPAIILAVPSGGLLAHRGYPKQLSPDQLNVDSSEVSALLDFCKKYDIVAEDMTPKWYLTSYMG